MSIYLEALSTAYYAARKTYYESTLEKGGGGPPESNIEVGKAYIRGRAVDVPTNSGNLVRLNAIRNISVTEPTPTLGWYEDFNSRLDRLISMNERDCQDDTKR